MQLRETVGGVAGVGEEQEGLIPTSGYNSNITATKNCCRFPDQELTMNLGIYGLKCCHDFQLAALYPRTARLY